MEGNAIGTQRPNRNSGWDLGHVSPGLESSRNREGLGSGLGFRVHGLGFRGSPAPTWNRLSKNPGLFSFEFNSV